MVEDHHHCAPVSPGPSGVTVTTDVTIAHEVVTDFHLFRRRARVTETSGARGVETGETRSKAIITAGMAGPSLSTHERASVSTTNHLLTTTNTINRTTNILLARDRVEQNTTKAAEEVAGGPHPHPRVRGEVSGVNRGRVPLTLRHVVRRSPQWPTRETKGVSHLCLVTAKVKLAPKL